MKTKPFLLATSGATVDGRTIEPKMLVEMADSYDPKTYGARLNLEHIRGISGQAPFRAYGDVLELSTAEVEVDFNGKTEKRTGLFGVLDVTDDAKALNDASQKVYPSIEIEPNFAGKGFAYLMGCALTDSPASIATDRLQFNRQMPGTLHLSRDEAAALEFDVSADPETATGLLASMKSMFDTFTAQFAGAPKGETKPEVEAEQQPAAFDFAQVKPLFEQFATTVAGSIDSLRTEMREEVDAIALNVKKLAEEQEETPARDFVARPAATGANGKYAKTDC